MSDPAATLIERCQYQADIKKSRFSAQAAPTAAADEALAFVHAINGTEATHHCWANRIGADCRFNDDGEPGGTAGRPILPAIEGQEDYRTTFPGKPGSADQSPALRDAGVKVAADSLKRRV